MTLAETQRSQRKTENGVKSKDRLLPRQGHLTAEDAEEDKDIIHRPFVASGNRNWPFKDRQLVVLGSLRPSQSITSNVAGTIRSFVASGLAPDVKDKNA